MVLPQLYRYTVYTRREILFKAENIQKISSLETSWLESSSLEFSSLESSSLEFSSLESSSLELSSLELSCLGDSAAEAFPSGVINLQHKNIVGSAALYSFFCSCNTRSIMYVLWWCIAHDLSVKWKYRVYSTYSTQVSNMVHIPMFCQFFYLLELDVQIDSRIHFRAAGVNLLLSYSRRWQDFHLKRFVWNIENTFNIGMLLVYHPYLTLFSWKYSVLKGGSRMWMSTSPAWWTQLPTNGEGKLYTC